LTSGPWVPEFGDHGGVIVLADTQRRTNTFMYFFNFLLILSLLISLLIVVIGYAFWFPNDFTIF
jgi:hypothetical protein